MELGKAKSPRLRASFTAALALFVLLTVVSPPPEVDAQADFDARLVELVNEWRMSKGIPPLMPYGPLQDKAREWSEYMAGGADECQSVGTRFGHSRLSLSDPANPPGTTAVSENIGYLCGVEGRDFNVTWPDNPAGPLPDYCDDRMDYASEEMVMCRWLGSRTHRPTIENPDLTHMGSGTASVDLGDNFGSRSVERFVTHVFTSSEVPQNDPSCNGVIDIGDALAISQYEVGIRTDSGGCPLHDLARGIHLAAGDINEDGSTNIGDALIIARCAVGIDSPYCPE